MKEPQFEHRAERDLTEMFTNLWNEIGRVCPPYFEMQSILSTFKTSVPGFPTYQTTESVIRTEESARTSYDHKEYAEISEAFKNLRADIVSKSFEYISSIDPKNIADESIAIIESKMHENTETEEITFKITDPKVPNVQLVVTLRFQPGYRSDSREIRSTVQVVFRSAEHAFAQKKPLLLNTMTDEQFEEKLADLYPLFFQLHTIGAHQESRNIGLKQLEQSADSARLSLDERTHLGAWTDLLIGRLAQKLPEGFERASET